MGLRSERARRRIFIGCAVGEVGEVGEVGDCTLSFELEMLPDEAERRRDSSIVACRSTLAREYGVAETSRISTNLEPDMIVMVISFWSCIRIPVWRVVGSSRSIEMNDDIVFFAAGRDRGQMAEEEDETRFQRHTGRQSR